MKFLIDRCAGTRLAAWLRDHGHDVLEAQSLGAGIGAEALLERAAASGRVMITIDSDFGELIHRQRATHAGLIRLPDVPFQRRIELTAAAIDQHSQALENNALATILGEGIQVSYPPVN